MMQCTMDEESILSTAKQIRTIMDKLNLWEVERHFEVESDANDDRRITEHDNLSDIEPFVVHNKVSVDAFYKYINDSEDFDGKFTYPS